MTNIIVHSAKTQRNPHAIFVAAGDRETFASYALDRLAADFDILIFFYGRAAEKRTRFARDAELFAAGAGTKFTSLKDIYLQRPELLLRYQTVWVCDDDVKPEHGDVRLLPAACTALNIPVLSPAHSRNGKISHPITLPRLGRHILRYTSFVEMTCPLFATADLVRFLEVYGGRVGGYADDWWFLNVLEADRRPAAAIVDAVTIVNPHDFQKPGGYSEIEQLGRLDTLKAHWREAMMRHGLREWPARDLLFVRPSLEGVASIGGDPSLFKRDIKAQLRIFLTELNYQLRFYGMRKWFAARLRLSGRQFQVQKTVGPTR